MYDIEKKRLPIGIENFEEMRTDEYYYVDKTAFIRDLLRRRGKVNLFTRPRRFGKTLNMAMLKSFFRIGGDKTIFDGLDIAKETALCEKYMGIIRQYRKCMEHPLCHRVSDPAGRIGWETAQAGHSQQGDP